MVGLEGVYDGQALWVGCCLPTKGLLLLVESLNLHNIHQKLSYTTWGGRGEGGGQTGSAERNYSDLTTKEIAQAINAKRVGVAQWLGRLVHVSRGLIV